MVKKNITHTAAVLIEIWNVAAFILVWFFYYNRYMFDSYRMAGGFVTILLYLIIYNALCHIYKSFRIASSPIGETVFSQVLSFGIPDLILYVECCLIYNRYVNILPGVVAVAAQILGTIGLVTGAKRYFMRHIEPQRTMIVYGSGVQKSEVELFQNRILQKYAHLFKIVSIENESVPWDRLKNDLAYCSTVVFYELSADKRSRWITWCQTEKKSIYFTPSLADIALQGCTVKHLLDTPLLKYDYAYERQLDYGVKRLWDIVLSLLLLVVVSPIFLVTTVAIWLEDRGPVFFKQKRCTKDAKVFEILKFRSMVVDAEKDGVVPCQENDSRITRVGKIIRATRIDELPQLVNILKGDMSFVGPRPERVEHVEQYQKELPEFKYRMRVKGGLTGYAQIFGKYNTSAYDKLRLDLIYIENQSLLLDLKLMMLTIRTIFQLESTEGFSEEKSRNMNRKLRKNEKLRQNTQERKEALLGIPGDGQTALEHVVK